MDILLWPACHCPCHTQLLCSRLPYMRAQEFVNHGGVLFKLYILGDKVMVFRRNSLPDIQPGDDQSGPQQAVQLLEQKSSEALAVLVGSTAKEPPKEKVQTEQAEGTLPAH